MGNWIEIEEGKKSARWRKKGVKEKEREREFLNVLVPHLVFYFFFL